MYDTRAAEALFDWSDHSSVNSNPPIPFLNDLCLHYVYNKTYSKEIHQYDTLTQSL